MKRLAIYLMCGRDTPELAAAAVEGGADLIELGFPFSDPLADGPVVRAAAERALAEGMRTRECLDCLARTRALVDVPLVPMTYASLLEAYGWERFEADARAAGADSLIVADLPADAHDELRRVQLVAPTSTDERIRIAAERTDGWLYLVTVAGTTGARDDLSPALAGLVERARALTDVPLHAGFGISTPAQARAAAELADGVVVGSAALLAADGGPEALARLRRVAAIRPGRYGRRLTLLLFDVDGTLFLTPDGLYLDALVESVREVWGHELTERELRPRRAPPRRDRDAGPPAPAPRRRARPVGDRRRPRRWCSVFSELYVPLLERTPTPHWRAAPQVVETLDELARSHELALLTGNPEPVARARMQRLGLDRFFPAGTGAFGCEAEERADLVGLARRRAGDPPLGEIVLVGDTPRDVSGRPRSRDPRDRGRDGRVRTDRAHRRRPRASVALVASSGTRNALVVEYRRGTLHCTDMGSLKGKLLVAGAALFDPHFRRAVVLVTEHDDDGALGLVLNRPAETTVNEAVPGLAPLVPDDAPVFVGGPVDQHSVLVVAEFEDPDESAATIFENVGFVRGRHRDRRRRRGDRPRARLRRLRRLECRPARRRARSRRLDRRPGGARGRLRRRGRGAVELRPPAPGPPRLRAARDDADRSVNELSWSSSRTRSRRGRFA